MAGGETMNVDVLNMTYTTVVSSRRALETVVPAWQMARGGISQAGTDVPIAEPKAQAGFLGGT